LTTLPPNFGSELSHIVQLNLSNNKLKELPETFHQLKSLVHLDLYSNQIRDLPPSLVHLRKLTFLDISKNPINPRLKAVVGQCSSSKECEAAAKNLRSHFNLQKETALKALKLAQKKKEEEQQKQKEAAMKQNKQEKKPAKKVEQKLTKQQNTPQPKTNKQNGAVKVVKKQPQQTSPKKKCMSTSNGRGILNNLILLTMIAASAYCFYVHCEGDYSLNGAKAALPRLKTNFNLVLNNTVTALRPENFEKTRTVVWQNVNSTAHLVAGLTKQKAYDFQNYLEPYTGDLTPYTSKVSSTTCQAINWVSIQLSFVWAWIWKNEETWRKVTDPVCKAFCMVYHRVIDGLVWFWSRPEVKQALEKAQEMVHLAASFLLACLFHLGEYLSKNFSIWVEITLQNFMNIATHIQDKINSMLK